MQQRQAKQRYKDYKKKKNGSKKILILFMALGILIAVGCVAIYYLNPQEEEEELVQEEGMLTIEKVGEQTTDSEDATIEDESVELTEEEIAEQVDSYLAGMNLEARIGQLFMTTPEELTGVGIVVQAGATTQEQLKIYQVGGLLFGSQNFEVVDQMKLMLNSIEAYTSIPILLAMDSEGALRVTNTNNTLDSMGFDLLYEEGFYLVQENNNLSVNDELNVVMLDEEDKDMIQLLEEGGEFFVITDGFTTVYTELLSAARSGEVDTELIEERVRAIMTYKVKHGI